VNSMAIRTAKFAANWTSTSLRSVVDSDATDTVVKVWRTTTPTDSEDAGIRWKALTVKENAISEIMDQPYF